MAWTNDAEFMRIIDGRRYMYKGVKRGIAIDGNISAYELGIPFQYLHRCPPDVQALNLNHWIMQERQVLWIDLTRK